MIFLFEVFMLDSKQAELMIYNYGLVPDQIRLNEVSNLYELRISILRPFLTNMFLHGGWGHLISNMWILFIFGDNVEDRMGKIRYFLFYIICGLLASFTHFMLNRNSPVPAIGASGCYFRCDGGLYAHVPQKYHCITGAHHYHPAFHSHTGRDIYWPLVHRAIVKRYNFAHVIRCSHRYCLLGAYRGIYWRTFALPVF